MIDTFLTLIEDSDVLSGWNSEGYDIPYTVNRTARVLSKDDTRRFCLWGQLPKKREYEKYGKMSETYDTIGIVHMDYLNLYRKYTYEERHSYRLDAIGEIEIGENKQFTKAHWINCITTTLRSLLNTTDKTLRCWISWTRSYASLT